MTDEQKIGRIIEQYGSEANYNRIKRLREIASKGGKNSTARPFRDPVLASKAGKLSASRMTPQQRYERSMKAVEAKRAKKLGAKSEG
jgi:general stress protein YciG